MNGSPMACVSRLAVISVAVWGTCSTAAGQNPTASLSSTTTPYTQNFDLLRQNNGTSGTMGAVTNRADTAPFTAASNPNALQGWRYRRGGTADTFVRGDGSSTTGQGYSFGNNFNDGEAALGVLTSGSNTGSYFGLILRNDTGTAVTTVTVTYTGEQWRFGGRTDSSADRLEFGYAVNANELPGTAGTTAVPQLNFSSPVVTGTARALDGNAAANRQTISFDLTLNATLQPGQDLALRWFDFDVSPGADDGMAIDNVSIAVFTSPVPEPTGVLFAAGAVTAGGWVARRRRRTAATAGC